MLNALPPRNHSPARMLICAALLVAAGLAGGGCASVGPDQLTASGVRPIYNAADFDRGTLAAGRPAILFFYSQRCPHCHAVMRKLPSIVNDYQGKVAFAAVDLANEGSLRARYGVGGVPVLVFFKNGREVDRLTGSWPSFVIRRHIRDMLE